MPETVNFKTWNGAHLIPTDQLVFTDWNCNEMPQDKLAELQADIEPEQGEDVRFDEPVQVVPIKGQTDKWLVLGGEHRTKVMISLGQEVVPCVIRWDLANKSRKDLMLWSVRRNNLRGRLNAQKYAELEDELVNDHDMAAEAARQTMLIGGDLAKALSASVSTKDAKSKDEDGTYEAAEKAAEQNDDQFEEQRSRADLLSALKVVEQDVLLDSSDTVEHGYLFFVQGKKGQTHLVVDESEELHNLVAKMVSQCKADDDKVDNFLVSAIENELKRAGS